MRRAHRLLVSIAVVVIVGGLLSGAALAGSRHLRPRARSSADRGLPVDAIQHALHAKGTVTDGVLRVGVERQDINKRHRPRRPDQALF